MNNESEIWIYRLIIAAAIGFIIWLSKGGLKKVIDLLDSINETLKQYGKQLVLHDERIATIRHDMDCQDKRITNHTERIREIERKQDGCQYCQGE